jgi:hypothetical protein
MIQYKSVLLLSYIESAIKTLVLGRIDCKKSCEPIFVKFDALI